MFDFTRDFYSVAELNMLSWLTMGMRNSGGLVMFKSRRTVEVVRWKLVQPGERESCRWQCVDGRWVSLALGHGAELGRVVVASSDGRRELVDAYEAALALAREWRS
jgi:hypothetical protein